MAGTPMDVVANTTEASKVPTLATDIGTAIPRFKSASTLKHC